MSEVTKRKRELELGALPSRDMLRRVHLDAHTFLDYSSTHSRVIKQKKKKKSTGTLKQRREPRKRKRRRRVVRKR